MDTEIKELREIIKHIIGSLQTHKVALDQQKQVNLVIEKTINDQTEQINYLTSVIIAQDEMKCSTIQ